MASPTPPLPYKGLVRKNTRILYEDTTADKEIIYSYLNEKISDAVAAPVETPGTKNLIYLSVFGSADYVSLLDRCLKSIGALSDKSAFTVMIITDAATKAKIQELSSVSQFPALDYFLVETPKSGIDASIQKLRIFEYPNVDQYAKILFLDCDILVTSPIEQMFATEIDPALIQVASTWDKPLANVESPSIYHVLNYFSEENKAYLINNPDKCHPFNAGQFLFVNSPRMKKHFENVQWMMEVWPGEYYFEQSFMNHYFMLNGFTSSEVLNPKTAFVSISDLENKVRSYRFTPATDDGTPARYTVQIRHASAIFKKKHDALNAADYYLVHFVGHSTNGAAKLKCVDQFIIDKNVCQ
jgi:hypothetical protein